jgi:membrane protein DedA with SNARE-associated domain
MALESACIPIPSEAIMLFAGLLGNLVGSWISYAVG